MGLPGYTAAEASLYRTTRVYWRVAAAPGGYAGPNVVAQDQGSCSNLCAGRWALCNVLCAETGPFLLPFCLGACFWDFTSCLNGCPPDSGEPPPPTGCCPPGRSCCGSCASGKCDDVCIGPGQSCP
jgi:hypothetical protein